MTPKQRVIPRSSGLTDGCLAIIGDKLVLSLKRPCARQILVEKRWQKLSKQERQKVARVFSGRIRFLKYRGLVNERRIGDRLILELTDGGRARLLRREMRVAPFLPSGNHVRVEYDFPEMQRAARNMFRYFLKTSGFTRFQQSIWVSRRDVYKLLCAFIREHELGDWVDVIVGRPADVPRRRPMV